MDSSISRIDCVNDESDDEKQYLLYARKKHQDLFYTNKYFGLALMSFSMVGQNFMFDNPAALNEILTKTLRITNAQFSSFYGIYYWPNSMFDNFLTSLAW